MRGRIAVSVLVGLAAVAAGIARLALLGWLLGRILAGESRADRELPRPVPDECLNELWFVTLADARRIIEAWWVEYNTERPHSALGYLTPEAFEQRTLTAAEPVGLSR